VRELGGYPVAGGGQTRYHRFLRSDGLNGLTEADAAFLHAYGVRLVLDLRDPDEVAERPDISLGDDVVVVNVPLLDIDISDKEALEKRFATEPPTYEFFYEMVLNKKEQMARCFKLIAQAPADACVLFHCAVGKDRTGILAMLLMALAGCDKWDCVANYVQTRANLMRHDWYVTYWENGDENDPLNDSPASAMEFTWELLQQMGGIVAYLHDCGVSHQEMEAVRSRLLA
jgi:protein-tyrosine phosphatase